MTIHTGLQLSDRLTLAQSAMLNRSSRSTFARDFIWPTMLFVALGGMTWAVRGCAGFGAWKGCIFAGVTWGVAWWYLAHDPRKEQSRRYASAWIVPAMTFGVGMAGMQGWMQWPSLFEGQLMTNSEAHAFLPISRSYGFWWLFLAGAKWAGIAACFMAWCGSLRETRVWHWFVRILCGLIGAYFAQFLIVHYPQHFLPLFNSIQTQYEDVGANPNLGRMVIDCTEAVNHLGLILGFLAFEVYRRDWKNVNLIVIVAVVTGAGWALCQNWKWAEHVWPDARFNFWRCWESSGGLCMGLAFGVAYFLVNRPMSEVERAIVASRRAVAGPNFEWLLIFLGLAWLLSIIFRIAVPWSIPLSGRLAEWLHRDRLEWSSFFFAVVFALGAAYYFDQRPRPIDAPPKHTGFLGVLQSIEWGALLLTAALIAGLFVSIGRRDQPGQFAQIGQRLGIDRGIDRLSDLMLHLTSFLGPSHEPLLRRGNSQIPVMQLWLAVVMLLGLAWYLIHARKFEDEKMTSTPIDGDANLERFGMYLGLLAGLGLSIQYGLKGCLLIYGFDEKIWDVRLQHALAPIYLVILLGLAAWILVRPLPPGFKWQIFPHAAALIWLVLVVQNVIAQAVTGPPTKWEEVAFNIYYVLLFAISAAIVGHFQTLKRLDALSPRP